MAGYVAVSNEALRFAREPWQMAAVLWLYREGDAARWGWFEARREWVAMQWGASEWGARRFLVDLAEAGLLEVEAGERNRSSRRIRVFAPVLAIRSSERSVSSNKPDVAVDASSDTMKSNRVEPQTGLRSSADLPPQTISLRCEEVAVATATTLDGAGMNGDSPQPATANSPQPPPQRMTDKPQHSDGLTATLTANSPQSARARVGLVQTQPQLADPDPDISEPSVPRPPDGGPIPPDTHDPPPQRKPAHRYREAWDEFNAIRAQHQPGAQPLDYGTWEREWQSCVRKAGSTDRLLRAWRCLWEGPDDWHRTTLSGTKLVAAFLRPTKLAPKLTAGDEWLPPAARPNGKELTPDQILAHMYPHRDAWCAYGPTVPRDDDWYTTCATWWQGRVPAIDGWRMADLQGRL